MNKHKLPVFDLAMGGLGFCLLLSVLIFTRAAKTKTDFESIKGPVEYITNAFPFYPNKNPDKYRYLKVKGYAKPFELFIGKEGGDFKPEFEKIDVLKPGDTVVVFFDDSRYAPEGPVNRLAYFIDRKDETIFVKGGWEKLFACFLAGLCLVLAVWVLRLKKKGKIS